MSRNRDVSRIFEEIIRQHEEIRSSREELDRRENTLAQTYQNLGNQVISIIYPDEVWAPVPSWKEYSLIPVPVELRDFFPGFRVPFILETEIGEIETHCTSAPYGTRVGDKREWKYIGKGLRPWYRRHPDLQPGDEILIAQIIPDTRYSAEIIYHH